MSEFPKIISVDDHVVEPANVWVDRLPSKYLDIGPRIVRAPVKEISFVGGKFVAEKGEKGDEGPIADWWLYEDLVRPLVRVDSAVGVDRADVTIRGVTYEEMRPGSYEVKPRLEDMDTNWTEAQLCFPTFPRFCGQTFTEAKDQRARPPLRQGLQRLDGRRVVRRVRRPPHPAHHHPALGRRAGRCRGAPQRRARRAGRVLQRDPAVPRAAERSTPTTGTRSSRACEETDTVIHMHIGSSSKMPSTSPDAPAGRRAPRSPSSTPASSLVDWLMSGVFVRFPKLEIAYSEGQIGWIPYILERADVVWEENRGWGGVADKVLEPPSELFKKHVYGCFFDDPYGLQLLDAIGVDSVTYETDYPHSDSTWPRTREVAEAQMGHLARRRGREAGPRQRHQAAAPRQALTAPHTANTHRSNKGSDPRMTQKVGTGPYRQLIGGEFVDGGKGSYDIVNPATEEVVAQAPEASVDDVEAAAAAAKAAQPAWAAMKPEKRAALLGKVSQRIFAEMGDFVPLIIAETGATMAVGSKMQVPACGARFRRLRRGRPAVPRLPARPVAHRRDPARARRPHLVGREPRAGRRGGGDHVVQLPDHEHGRQARAGPGCGQHRGREARSAGPAVVHRGGARSATRSASPPGWSASSRGRAPEAGQALVASPNVDMVSFTGSTAVGVAIQTEAAKTMKRTLLELGGKGAALVFDDADIKTVVTALASVWGFHSGQICTAPTRAIVHRSRYEEVVEALKAAAARMPVGDPNDPDHGRRAAHHRAAAWSGRGAPPGGHRRRGRAAARRWPPRPRQGLLRGAHPAREPTTMNPAAREEIFGPVIVVIPFDDDEEGIAIANDSPFGLYDYVFTADLNKGYQVARRLRGR